VSRPVHRADARSRLRRLQPLFVAATLGLAAVLVYRALKPHSLEEIQRSLKSISPKHLGLGAMFTAASYLCLTGFDALAVRYTRGTLPYRKIAVASLISLTIGHTLGMARSARSTS
jgi:uncharacterized membrane protein YbhN (UPF0104 family)